MYYIMSEEGSHILESQMNRPTAKELQETANFMRCEVYVIQGEHTGMSASPGDTEDDGHDYEVSITEDGSVALKAIGKEATEGEFNEAYERDFWQIKAGLGQ